MTNYIKILYWNIHGISSRVTGDKNSDPNFLKVISDYDVVCLSELHTNKTISIPGYSLKKQKFRQKTYKGPKICGGIAVFIKQSISANFKIIPNNNNDSIWVQSKDEHPLRLGFYYCSPESSNFFKIVNGEIESFAREENTYIFGDFNARTKTLCENITSDKSDIDLGVPTTMSFFPPHETRKTPSLSTNKENIS